MPGGPREVGLVDRLSVEGPKDNLKILTGLVCWPRPVAMAGQDSVLESASLIAGSSLQGPGLAEGIRSSVLRLIPRHQGTAI